MTTPEDRDIIGDVECGSIGGSVKTMSGNIKGSAKR